MKLHISKKSSLKDLQQVNVYLCKQQVDVVPSLLIRAGLKFHPAKGDGRPGEVGVSCKWEVKRLRSLLLVSVMYVAVWPTVVSAETVPVEER